MITLSHKVAGMYFAGAQDKHLFWDPELTRLQDRIDAARPQFSNFIISISTNGEHFVVASARANTPIEYLLAHRNEESPELLGSSYPQLQHISVSSKTAISYRASDGMEIQGFLTTPRGVKPIQLPTIVLPHGGPEQHDSGSFDVWAEFLADRGYAVLQPNFRGSTGYGSAFHRAGFNQWGLRMQDDISDGIKWLVAQGVADPTRVCIVGASYGGYMALMGALKTPELFKCAVSIAGVTDLELLLRERQKSVANALNQTRIGNPTTDQRRLLETSPVHLAQQLTIPVMIAHGDRDMTVSVTHAKRLASALRRAKKTYELLLVHGADHGLSNHHHRTRVFQAMETFLAKHIGQGPLPQRD